MARDRGWDVFLYEDGKRLGSINRFEFGYTTKEDAERSRLEWLRSRKREGQVDLRVERICIDPPQD